MSSLDYLLSFQKFGIKLGLDNISNLLAELGNPHHEFRSIHVAGTNGKGSVVALVHFALAEMGYRVGRFTSPHLVEFSERIVIGGDPIDDTRLDELVAELRPAVEKMKQGGDAEHPTFFEAVTALAFMQFAREKVDFAIVEVGMGGRYDSTNVIDPCVTVVNSISMEHRDYLGDTLKEIAGEKAGIIKPGVEVISATQEPDARQVIEARAGECESPAYYLGTDFDYEVTCGDFPSQRLDFRGPWRSIENIEINLAGRFQAHNAALAVMTLETLREKGLIAQNDSHTDAALRRGFAAAKWPARLEMLSELPCMILDSAHNPAAMKASVDSLIELFPARKVVPVVGMLGDKDVAASLEALRLLGDTIIVSQPDYERAMSAAALAEIATGIFEKVLLEPTISSAIERAIAITNPDDIILITGSLFNVAEVREYQAQSERNG
jgi:dihydrofolate synthase/folylpolyglutamate synthase